MDYNDIQEKYEIVLNITQFQNDDKSFFGCFWVKVIWMGFAPSGICGYITKTTAPYPRGFRAVAEAML